MDRSKSYAGGRTTMQIEPYYGGGGGRPVDFRSYSYSGGGRGGAGASYQYQYEYGGVGGGGGGGGGGSGKVGYCGSVAEERATDEAAAKRSKSKRRWLALGDPDMERKRRVASYKAYSVEGKVKGSFRKSFKWIKDRYLHLVYGWS